MIRLVWLALYLYANNDFFPFVHSHRRTPQLHQENSSNRDLYIVNRHFLTANMRPLEENSILLEVQDHLHQHM